MANQKALPDWLMEAANSRAKYRLIWMANGRPL